MRCSSSSIVRWLLAKWLHKRCTICSRWMAVGASEIAEGSGLIGDSRIGLRKPTRVTTRATRGPAGAALRRRRPGFARAPPQCCLTQGDDVVAAGDDHEVVAPVLRPTVLRVLRAHGTLVPIRDDVDPAGIDPR